MSGQRIQKLNNLILKKTSLISTYVFKIDLNIIRYDLIRLIVFYEMKIKITWGDLTGACAYRGEDGQNLGRVETCVVVLAETSSRSPRKLFIFSIKKKHF